MTSKSAPAVAVEKTRSVVLGTAGHVDHGKTALVLALTGTDTDRLPEEKARGITIDLGFAALDLTGPDGTHFEVSLVDVPGHQAFVRNMLAGAGGIDAVMLVIAADEGVKAQTIEHLEICRLLGIQKGLVVLTKRDAVDADRLSVARHEVARLVEGTFLEGAPVLPVSALQREGLGEVKAALTRLVASLPARAAGTVMRLPIDRAFTVRGFGTVVTGTLQAGCVRVGESLRLEPGNRAVRVRGVQVHGRTRAEAGAPNRVALNLAGIEVSDVARGDVVLAAETLEPVSVADVALELSAGAAALRHRQRVRLHAFAGETPATLLLYDPDGDATPQLARLKLAKPMVLAPGDRFVLRQMSPAMTLGGGRVLDAHPMPRVRKTAVAAWLNEIEAADPDGAFRLRVQRRGLAGLTLGQLVVETGRTRDSLRQSAAAAIAQGVLVAGPGEELLVEAATLARSEAEAVRELARTEGKRLSRTELRARLRLTDTVAALLLRRLEGSGQVQLRGDLVLLPDRAGTSRGAVGTVHGPAHAVEELYRAAGLAAPLVSEVATRLNIAASELRRVLTELLRAGKLVRLGSDALLVHGDALAALTAELRNQHRGLSLDVGWFKSYTGLTRKHAIPLLEYLDGARVTRNSGGKRVVI